MENLSKADKKAYEEWLVLCNRISKATDFVPKETEQEKRKRIKMLLRKENFEKACKYYFADFMDSNFGWFQKEAISNVLYHNNGLHIWEWAREHAKSILADVFIPLILKAKGELTGMMIASETEAKAKNLLKDIHAQLVSNKRYINDFGEQMIIGSWLQGNFFTANDGIGFWAFGIGQSPVGVRNAQNRPNYGVADDCDSLKLSKNQTRTKEAVDWIKGEFLGCLAIKHKWFIYANNRLARKGITAHMVGDIEEGDPKNDKIMHIKVYALEDANHNIALPGNPEARPAWVERYTYQQIIGRMGEMGYRNSLRQFFHMHIVEGNVFTDSHIVFTEDKDWDYYDALVCYVDPSFKDTVKNDFKAVGMLGKKGKYIDILWLWIRQDKKSNMVKAHYDLHERVQDFNKDRMHKPITVRHFMEANFIQDLMLNDYEQEGEHRGYQLSIRKDVRAKPEKKGRIEDLEPLMARGLVRFAESLRKSKDFVTLKDQFLGFPNGHDDGPDMIEGGVWQLNRQTKNSNFTPRMGKAIRNPAR